MLFFYDESGDFAKPSQTRHSYGLIGCITVPETAVDRIRRAYAAFLDGLPSDEMRNGEPKGNTLTPRSRNLFGRVLAELPDILTHVTVLDLATSQQDMVNILPRGMHDALLKQVPQYTHQQMRDSIALLARQVGNLSVPQFARLFALGQTLHTSFNLANLHYLQPEQACFYNSLEFVVDNVASREQIVFDKLLRLWIETWTFYEPGLLVREVHQPGHPLIDKYSCEGGLSGRKVFCENLKFVDSRDSWGVQIADIIVNTAYQAVSSPSEAICIDLANMLRGSRGIPWNALSLFAFGERRAQLQAPHLKEFIGRIEQITGYRYVSWHERYRPPDDEEAV